MASLSATRPHMRIVDLSHHYADDMPVFPGLPKPWFSTIARVEEP